MDGQAKTASYRYTKNQYENNIDRHLDYGFTLPNGTYTVEMSFSNPWNCSTNPTVYANYGEKDQATVAEKCATDGTTVKGTVKVTNGKLTLNFRSADKAINVNYILIRFGDDARYSVVGKRGDVNLDGKVTAADAAALLDYLLTKKELTWEQAYAADVQQDLTLDSRDLTVLKRQALGK